MIEGVNESLFPLICHYVFPNKNFEDSYDDFYYDGVKHGGQENMINKPTGFDNLNGALFIIISVKYHLIDKHQV